MPIAALPPTTIRAIGSASVISDPCSVVKELVDNALDASASSVMVEMSQNTVDVIQLKDNGHGISSEDYPNVCKRTFTSKIQTVDDLRTIGGASLGFRGEALASVAELSGGVTITTRVDSEVAGSCLKYGRDGELTATQRVSHPVGTTVRITDLLKHIPVRRQTVLKSAAKTLARIKKLLQAYAMAQPSKRFSLKVMKAKNENGNWMYAPGATASLSDAAMKIVGTEISSSCMIKEASIANEIGDGEPSDKKFYQLVAFLPKSDTDPVKVHNVGQFFSVDGRPLSTSRGIGHDVVKMFKSYLRAAGSRAGVSKSATDPFLCVQLQCPRGTYDVNIEPAKDDILFADRDLVVSLAERLFRDHYGEIEGHDKPALDARKGISSQAATIKPGFEILMAQRRPEPAALAQESANDAVDQTLTSPVSHRCSHSPDTSSVNSLSSNTPRSINPHQNAGSKRNTEFVNPWSITRINASFSTPRREQVPPSSTTPQNFLTGSPQEPVPRRPGPTTSNNINPHSPELPSPPTSRVASTSPVRRRQRPPEPAESSIRVDSPDSSRSAARKRDRERYGNGALDTWFLKTTQASLGHDTAEDTPMGEENEVPLSQLSQGRFDTQTQDPSPGDRSAVSNPNIHLSQSINSGRGFPVLEKWAASLREEPNTEAYPGLERALDFEKRKKEAMQRRRTHTGNRDKQPVSEIGHPSQRSLHSSRYLAAKAALTSERNFTTESISRMSLSPHDPRAYLIHHHAQQNSQDGSKARRIQTSRLPFEKIPEGHDLHKICLPQSADFSHISGAFQHTMQHDLYAECGIEDGALSASHVDALLPLWSRRLAAIINEQYKTRDTWQSPEWQIDLSSVVFQHLRNSDECGD
ncbi:DNA mismatch repair protein [Penicillium alfredii]|uniref:DNA mismatch repair protein n=1 Tax=Penicillium alfredii TaxID=1506179 RepID=A0A9W9G994_9EURO|nr:DNA mismatch repair protein [Penicillium alfredii]KAJ5114396.1 DNA mismatch repair protein [Penicillium alfredii]